MDKNPLLEKSNLPFAATHFNSVKIEHYVPALKKAIELAQQRITEIKKQEPSFENTILALETCSEEVSNVSGVYFNLFSSNADDAHQALAPEMSSLSSAFSSDVLLDQELFEKVKIVFDQKDQFQGEDLQLLKKTYKGFVRNGALLSSEDKKKLREIDQELSQLSPKFSENVLKDTNAFEYHITDKEKLAGLPDSAVAAAEHTAQEKKKEGWIFTLQAPSLIPFLTYSEDREAREMIWRAYNSGATKGETDNSEILKNIAKLRHKRASLLGFKTHADFVLAERMAESPEKVKSFLAELLEVSREAAEKDLQELKEFKKELSGDDEVFPWDFGFYSEKLKEKKYSFNQEELRPYFQLEKVVQGAFDHAEKLYGLNFKSRSDIEGYHEDVEVFEVIDKDSSEFIGLFYTDFFPRATKKNGAWMTNYKEQGLSEGTVHRPHVSIVCNFTKPTKEKPSLLTIDEVRTLFHEFGHALHSLLSRCKYQSLSGTNVYWDFVELPSQINENWILEKETLDQFAKHYETGELLPEEYAKKIKAASQFQAGYSSLRQLNFGLLDMAWHAADPSNVSDIESFEVEATKKSRVLPHIKGTMISPRFSHIFAGGYSAGYYSYKWAEVLDADAFEAFKEKGLYDKETADLFRKNILERGGTEHPMDLYKKFRGREPDPKALLKRDGLI